MKFYDWLNQANRNIDNTLVSCINNSHIDAWSENHITTQVLESLETLGLDLDWEDKPQKVKWEGFKLKGKVETAFGDIALIVKVWITSDRYIEGVAFYEAKRQFFDEKLKVIGFTSIKQDQLSRINSNTYASNVLLYDVDIEEGRARATSVPIAFVDELAKAKLASSSGRLLHQYGDLWVKAIGNNFLGMNLDFQKESVDKVRESMNTEDRPFVILNAAVAMTSLLEPKLDDSFINKADYEKWIKPDEPKPEIKNKPRDNGPSTGM